MTTATAVVVAVIATTAVLNAAEGSATRSRVRTTAASGLAPPIVVRRQWRTVRLHGTSRRYLLVAPVRPPRSLPLVLVLHGYRMTAISMERLTGLDALARDDEAAVAYPSGVDASWDAGLCCGFAAQHRVDDVAFLADVAADAARAVGGDGRVVWAGFSNGGMMVERLACDVPGVVSAAVVDAGTLEDSCRPARPVRLVVVEGASDPVVPLLGGWSGYLRMSLESVRASAAEFAAVPRSHVSLITLPRVAHHWTAAATGAVDAAVAEARAG